MMSFHRIRDYSYKINHIKFGGDRIRIGRVIEFTSSRGIYRKWRHYDVTDNVIIMKFNRVLHLSLRINPVKLHQDRKRIGWVIGFTRMSTDRRRQTSWLQYPSFCQGVKNWRPTASLSLCRRVYQKPGCKPTQPKNFRSFFDPFFWDNF